MQLNAAAMRWFNDLAAQGILITDGELLIRGWNNWLESHTGYRASEIIGKHLLDFYPDLVKRGLDEYFRDALAGQIRVISQRLHGYILPMPHSVEDVSFTNMQQSARIAPLIESEQVIGTITIIEDVTERVAREDQLVRLLAREKSARAEAEAANRSKDEFLATVSHELRTPLNSILGWVQILRNSKLDIKSLEHALEAVERGARAQTSLIEDILDASRITTGKLHLELRPVELVSIIQDTLEIVRPAAEARQIQLHASLHPLGGLVSGDPKRLQQIVWNLLSNAIKFTPKGGRVEVSLQRMDSQIELAVKDTGQGIPEAFLPFVFDPFRQANSTSTRRHGGLGLGLAIVHHVVEMHGGTVHADSAGEGQGATFAVRLPAIEIARGAEAALGDADQDESGQKRDLAPLADGVRVLVVDDDSDARELLTVMLSSRGVDVRTAATAADALATVEVWKPDVMVSDIGMPDEDGFTLIKRIRSLDVDRGGQIPAVALTGYTGPEDRRRLLSAGYQICLPKPVDFADLTVILANLAGPLKSQ